MASEIVAIREARHRRQEMRTVEVEKAQLQNSRIVEKAARTLVPGQALLRIESFAVTANNVTYAVIGDAFGYWNFFPASEAGWGVVPMWGHAVVEQSTHADLPVGERVYGYLPMASHLVVSPGDVRGGGFSDIAAHRQPMSPIYNQYSRLAADPEHDPAREDARMIFGPLFKTGFLIEAMFRRENWFGAEQLVMTSASSKTAMALAHCARESSPGIRRIGLTSEANAGFVAGTGLYDETLLYNEASELLDLASVLVDFAGNAELRRTVHGTLGDALKYSCLVGATHVDARGGSDGPLPGPAPILFFAPDHARASIEELGARRFGETVGASWRGFMSAAETWVTVDRRDGLDAAVDIFGQTLAGMADPSVGVVIRP